MPPSYIETAATVVVGFHGEAGEKEVGRHLPVSFLLMTEIHRVSISVYITVQNIHFVPSIDRSTFHSGQ